MDRKLSAIILAGLIAAFSGGPALAGFPTDEVTVLEPKDISLLTDDKLIDTYIDVLAEMDASKAFHATSGFTPKEYKKYRDLVKYRLRLIFEIHRRKLEIPPEVN